MWQFIVTEADNPTSRLVFKLIRFIYEFLVVFSSNVAPVVYDNLDDLRHFMCFNLNLNILIVMLETELRGISRANIIPSENWFIYRSYLALF